MKEAEEEKNEEQKSNSSSLTQVGSRTIYGRESKKKRKDELLALLYQEQYDAFAELKKGE